GVAGCPPFAGSTTLSRLMILVTSADVSGPAMDWWVEKTQQNPTTAKTDLIVSIDIWRLIVINTIILIGLSNGNSSYQSISPIRLDRSLTISPSACFPLRPKSCPVAVPS